MFYVLLISCRRKLYFWWEINIGDICAIKTDYGSRKSKLMGMIKWLIVVTWNVRSLSVRKAKWIWGTVARIKEAHTLALWIWSRLMCCTAGLHLGSSMHLWHGVDLYLAVDVVSVNGIVDRPKNLPDEFRLGVSVNFPSISVMKPSQQTMKNYVYVRTLRGEGGGWLGIMGDGYKRRHSKGHWRWFMITGPSLLLS